MSANDLTDETFIDELCGNAALNGVAVTIRRGVGVPPICSSLNLGFFWPDLSSSSQRSDRQYHTRR